MPCQFIACLVSGPKRIAFFGHFLTRFRFNVFTLHATLHAFTLVFVVYLNNPHVQVVISEEIRAIRSDIDQRYPV